MANGGSSSCEAEATPALPCARGILTSMIAMPNPSVQGLFACLENDKLSFTGLSLKRQFKRLLA